ncbi:MAG: winged helix-turn-helix domain-containing protein [Pseudomonadota bacterium]
MAPRRRVRSLFDVAIDLDARQATRQDQDLGLTSHEFNLLACLVERPGRAFTRDQLAEQALPEGGERTARTVDSHISRIRKKLGAPAGSAIQTVWGIGYRLQMEEH